MKDINSLDESSPFQPQRAMGFPAKISSKKN